MKRVGAERCRICQLEIFDLMRYVEPHGQSLWHLTNARAGRRPPPDVGTGRPKLGAFVLSRLNREGLSAAGGKIFRIL